MTAVYRDEARDALRRERARASHTTWNTNLIAKLKRDLEKPTPVILDHMTVRGIVADLEKLERIEKAVRS